MAKVELEGNADAVEFCPNKPYWHILAAASYTLQEGHDNQGGAVRLGGLYLFSADQQADHRSSTLGLTKLYHHETPGVFDIKWRPYDDGPPCLAEASADGSLRLHTLREGPESSTVELHEKTKVDVSTCMCLYVDWNPIPSNPQLALSHSDGSVSLVTLGQSQPEITASWQAHDFEAWIVTYDSWKPQVVYSGGDDCQFCGWDLREDPACRVFRDKKSHQMGVCSIQSNPLWENMLITGSYDENIRLWDLRMMQKPMVTAELGLGGGVWRLKWHHTDRELILAACMHNGAAIARVGEGRIQLLEQYKEHTSLTYGASWYQGNWDSDSQHDVAEGHGLEGTCNEGFGSPGGAYSGPDDSKHVPQHDGAMVSIQDVKGAKPRLKAGELTEGEDGSEAGLAVKLGELNMESTLPAKLGRPMMDSSRGMQTVAATCSFYDKAVHLWRPSTVAFSSS